MRIWVDNYTPAPRGYVWCKTTNEAKTILICVQRMQDIEVRDNLPTIEVVDFGDYSGSEYGGPYTEILDFMEKNQWNFPVHIHGRDRVEIKKMLEIIRRNGWPAA